MKNPYELYIYYLALKKHFTSSYDFFKYNGKVKASVDAFEKRRDKFFFHKISKRADAETFLLANILYDPTLWIGDLVDNPKAVENANEWVKRQQAISYVFKSEISELDTDYGALVKVDEGQWPRLLQLHHQRKIGLDTLIIIDSITNVFSYWNNNISDSVLWPTEYNLLLKAKGFIDFDREKMFNIMKNHFQ